jgi:uncharacterized repeat protein (TIGR03806 family)
MSPHVALLAATAGLLSLAGCGGSGGGTETVPVVTPPSVVVDPQTPPTEPAPTTFTAATAPTKLSAWNMLHSDGESLELGEDVLPYSLNTPLFSDYAHKFRSLWIPEGTQITYTTTGPLQFPVGAVLTKTFYYPRAEASAAGLTGAVQSEQTDNGDAVDLKENRLIETRLMVREPSGRWGAVTYVWDADQRDATLVRTGQNIGIELVSAQGGRTPFTYAVPTDGQCLTCHATDASTGAFEPIGPRADNLNREQAYADGTRNQLEALAALQKLDGYVAPAPRLVVWNDAQAATVDARARAYLDVNCASCHNPAGRSGYTGLWLGVQETGTTRLGICKPPVGGQQNGRFSFDVQPGSAEQSFLYFRVSNYRLNSDPPRVAMPELGRHVFHAEGNALIRDWVDGMAPGCGT